MKRRDNNNRFGCDDVFGYPVDRFRVQQRKTRPSLPLLPSASVSEAQLSDVLEILVEGADKAIYSVANVDTAAYYQATLYLNVNDASYELAVKGTFDENTESKNGGLVELQGQGRAGAMAPVLRQFMPQAMSFTSVKPSPTTQPTGKTEPRQR